VRPDREHYSQRNQSEFIDNLLKRKRDGFYIECGAADGEGLSNTLFFEKSRNWNGLLIEANPHSFAAMLKKRRHAYMINACLSPTRKPLLLPFKLADYIGGLANYMEKTHADRIQESFHQVNTTYVQCFPLYSILKALNVTYVDYFSLDIEGAELEVLYTIPLDLITIDVFSIEYQVSGNSTASKNKLETIKKYLVNTHGYRIVRVGIGEDVILKKSYISP
jgi:FkbM family methyltransferase